MNKEEDRLREQIRQERNSAIALGSVTGICGVMRAAMATVPANHNADLVKQANTGFCITASASAAFALISVGLMMKARQKLNSLNGPK